MCYSIVIKLHDENGHFAGILKAVLNTGRIIRDVEIAKRAYETTRIRLITKNGRLIYSTKTFTFFGDISDKIYFKKIKDEKGFFIAKHGGRERLYSYSSSKGFRGFEGFGWILLVEHDVEEILKPSFALRNRMLAASLVLIAAGVIFAFLMSLSITRPLQKLAKDTEIIGKGDLAYRIDVKTKDEIGILAGAFNKMVNDLEETTASRDELNREIVERKLVEKAFEKQTSDLNERAKELNCLYEISSMIQETEISIEKILQRVVILIPPAWQYPEITCSRISWEAREFRTKNFRETEWKQASDIVINGEVVGKLEVFYLDEKPEDDEGPFMGEERALINAIADRLGKAVEQWEAEEELERHRTHLEETVKKRTSDLNKRISEVEQLNSAMVNLLEDLRVSNESLEIKTQQLGTTNKELDAFAYSVSHDLRAPLRAIDGFSQMLTEDHRDKIDKEGQHQLDVIQGSARQMGQLIDDLLAFSRLGRKGLSISDIDMQALAKDVVKQLRIVEGEKTARLKIDSLPPAQGDRAMIREVFVNLLSNAIKYVAPGETAVIYVAGKIDGDENIYSVKDNGVGFDMKYADKLFQVFQRLHGSEYEGTGIGLALVHRIIHRHGGRVWGEGKVDEGATFYFSLPRS